MRTWKDFRWTGAEGACLSVLVFVAIWSMFLPEAKDESEGADQDDVPARSVEQIKAAVAQSKGLFERQRQADVRAAQAWVASLAERPTLEVMQAEYRHIFRLNEAASAVVINAIRDGKDPEVIRAANKRLQELDEALITHEYRMKALGYKPKLFD